MSPAIRSVLRRPLPHTTEHQDSALAGQTLTNLIANAVETLLAHPDQLAALRDDPSLMPRAVEELMRWCGPQLLTIPGYAREDVDITRLAL